MMLEYLQSLPEQARDAFLIGTSARFPKKFNSQIKKVIYCGMGGSGISGDVLKVFFDKTSDKSWTVLKDYKLPAWADPSTLIVLSSYSGNTLEMKSVLQEALYRRLPVMVQTSGGVIGDISEKKKLVKLELPSGFPPRSAVGYLTFSLLALFVNAGWIQISVKDWDEVFDTVQKFPKLAARKLARQLNKKNIRFYGGGFLEPVALRWKTQFAENAKTLTGFGAMPEIFHHEVEGWNDPSAMIRNSVGVFFTDSSEPRWLVKKRQVAVNWMKKSGAKVLLIPSVGSGYLAKIFYLIMLGDWASYELALLKGEDPLAIRVIDQIKQSEKTV